jgi:hypothetical protein
MEPASPPPKRTPAPRTPVGARNQPKAPTPGRSRPAPALFEDYAAFSRAARRAAAAVGTRAAPGERRDAVADVCWRACADAVARRVPPPRTLAVAWVPQLIQELGASTRVEARALRRAVRARCVRPPLQRATTETLPARSPTRTSSADEARRKLRDAELQVLLRVTLSADARRLQDRDFRAVRAIVEHASFALNAPHVRCEPPRRARPADDADYHVDYASLPSFVATALQPPLSTLAPEVLDRLAAALELASQDEPPPPPRRRPRQNDDGAWPAPARSMLPPAKRPRLERRASSSSGGAPSGGSWAAFCAATAAAPAPAAPAAPSTTPAPPAAAPAPRARPRRAPASAPRSSQPLARTRTRPPPPPPAAPPPVRAPLRRAGSLDRAGSLRLLGASTQRRVLGSLAGDASARRAPPRSAASAMARAPAPARSPAARGPQTLVDAASPSPPRQRGGARARAAAARRRGGSAAARRSGSTGAPAPAPAAPAPVLAPRIIAETPPYLNSPESEDEGEGLAARRRAVARGKERVRGRLAF